MLYLGSGVFFIWLAGLYFFAGRSRDHIRLALDHRTPDARPSDFTRCGFRKFANNIDPALLTESGRDHLKQAIRTERIMVHWLVDGFLLVVLAFL
jgi:hypothetical protein